MAERFDFLIIDYEDEQTGRILLKNARSSLRNKAALSVAVVNPETGANALRLGADFLVTRPINLEQSEGILRLVRSSLLRGKVLSAESAATVSAAEAPPEQSNMEPSDVPDKAVTKVETTSSPMLLVSMAALGIILLLTAVIAWHVHHPNLSADRGTTAQSAAANSPAPNTTDTPVQNKTAANVHDDQATTANHATTANQSTHSEELLAWFTGALVLVSFLQAYLFLRQARIMEEHRTSFVKLAEAAADNAEAASKNAEFSKLNASATEKNAEAALLNAQVAIHAQRPWVAVKIAHRISEAKGNPYFLLQASNTGKSAARILTCNEPIEADYTDPDRELRVPPDYGSGSAWVERFLAPGDSFDLGYVNMTFTGTDARRADRCASQGINVEDAKFIVYGRITYDDGISPLVHETRYCYKHEYLPSYIAQTVDTDGGRLVLSGPREYNLYT